VAAAAAAAGNADPIRRVQIVGRAAGRTSARTGRPRNRVTTLFAP